MRARDLCSLASQKGLAFDISKTDLFHFLDKKATSLSNPLWAVVGSHQIHYRQTLRWLGIHLKDDGRLTEHTKVRAAKAVSAFALIFSYIARMKQEAAARIVVSLVLSSLTYGLKVWADRDINDIDFALIKRVIRSSALVITDAFPSFETFALCTEAGIFTATTLVESCALRAFSRIHNLSLDHPLAPHRLTTRFESYLKPYFHRH